jgi:hypothetical protein
MSNPTPGSGGGSAPPERMYARRPPLEINPMNAHTTYAWTVHADRLARLHEEADHERFARSVPTDPRRLRPRDRPFARPGRPEACRGGGGPGPACRAFDAGRLPLMRGRPASPTPRETLQ